MRDNLKNLLVWGGLFVAIAFGIQTMRGDSKSTNSQLIEYSQFIQQVKAGSVNNVNIEGSPAGYEIKGERNDKSTFRTNAPLDDKLVETLINNNVRMKVTPEENRACSAAYS